MYTLHVLGPAFGLPSIDADCNAAVALLKLHFSTHGQDESWQIVIGHDHTITLPSLRTPEGKTISGFTSIAAHFAGPTTNSTQTSADATALSYFVLSHAPVLLAISLYVSATNYYSNTSKAFTKILPWHANYILPPARRAAAKRLTDGLGIGGLDVDSVHEDMSNKLSGSDNLGKEQGAGFEAQARARASMLLPAAKETLNSFMGAPETRAVFKLHALADNFFAPLEAWLGKKGKRGDSEAVFGGAGGRKAGLGELDCLIYGFLSLMLFPKLDQDWLAKRMRGRYERLVRWTERMHRELRLETRVEDVVALKHDSTARHNLTLPWTASRPPTIPETARTIGTSLLQQIPIFAPRPTILTIKPSRPSYLPQILLGFAASLALGGYYAFHTGLLIWPHGEATQVFGRKRFADYGHLGAALSGIGLLSQQARSDRDYREEVTVEESPLVVGVAVEEG